MITGEHLRLTSLMIMNFHSKQWCVSPNPCSAERAQEWSWQRTGSWFHQETRLEREVKELWVCERD